mgnify:CR=1 FL=1
MNQGSQKGRPAPRPGEAWIHEDMSEEELLDMPRPVRIDPIDRSLPTDADVGAQELLEMLADLIDPAGPVLECRLCGEKAAQRAEGVQVLKDGCDCGAQPRFECKACGGSWREGWT